MMDDPRASCAEIGLDMFHPPPGESATHIRMLKRVCASCEIRVRCLNFALENGVDVGIWGGSTPTERRVLARVVQGYRVRRFVDKVSA